MNNKGQTLILFLLILPIVIGFLAFFVDISMVSYEKSKINGIIESNLEVIVLSDIKDYDKINKAFSENDIILSNLEVIDEYIYVRVDKKIESLFEKLLKLKIYEFSVSYEGDYQNNKVNKIGDL